MKAVGPSVLPDEACTNERPSFFLLFTVVPLGTTFFPEDGWPKHALAPFFEGVSDTRSFHF